MFSKLSLSLLSNFLLCYGISLINGWLSLGKILCFKKERSRLNTSVPILILFCLIWTSDEYTLEIAAGRNIAVSALRGEQTGQSIRQYIPHLKGQASQSDSTYRTYRDRLVNQTVHTALKGTGQSIRQYIPHLQGQASQSDSTYRT